MSLTDGLTSNDPVAVGDFVRAKRGMPAIDSSRIAGFGENDPPPPDVPKYENPYPEIPAEVKQEVTRTFDEAQTRFQAVQPVRENIEVWYQGSKVAYNETLMNAVERLILAEGKKQLEARLKELSAPKVRQPKLANREKTLVEVAAPKRRGRPKGAKNKVKVVVNDVPAEDGEVPS